MSLSNVIQLRPFLAESFRDRPAALYRGQSVQFPDPDLPNHKGEPIMNEGTIAGFPDDDTVLVVIKDEPGAARRLPRPSIAPATP